MGELTVDLLRVEVKRGGEKCICYRSFMEEGPPGVGDSIGYEGRWEGQCLVWLLG